MPPILGSSKNFYRHYVQHNYHDHYQDIPLSKSEDLTSYHVTRNGAYDSEACSKSTRFAKFPTKLHELLENAEMDGLSNIISWKIHGRAFAVNNLKGFVERVMPYHFNQTKITSFFRQLNLYGFLRITHGRDRGSYYHELFLRGKPFLTTRMRRQKIKGTNIKGLPSPDTEPDFYSMPFVMVKSNPPTLTNLALPHVCHHDLLPGQSAALHSMTYSSLCASASEEAKLIDYSLHFTIDSSNDGKNIRDEGQSSPGNQGDVEALFSAKEDYLADFLLSDGENLCSLLQESEDFFDSSLNVDMEDDDFYPEIEVGLLDVVIQCFSTQECQILHTLLEVWDL